MRTLSYDNVHLSVCMELTVRAEVRLGLFLIATSIVNVDII